MARRSSYKNSKKSSNKKKYSINVFLPEELMFKILSLLPVITLLHCKLVCKSWLYIILNPQFIKTHLIESQKRQPLSLLKVTINQFYIHTDHETSRLLQLPQHFADMTGFVSCCNGLVCLTNDRCDVFYLWNPMTRQFKKLATPRNKQSFFHWFVHGFGYDDVSNDYKILWITFKYAYICSKTREYICSMHVEMYSVNEDSWKEIEVPKILEFFQFYRCRDVGVFLPQTPGVLYFEGFYELLAFDLHDEVFKVYPYPIPGTHPIFAQEKPRMSNLLNFEGSLAMIYDESIDDGESFYSLWTFDGECGNASWTKQFNLENSLKNDRVALYLGDGQFVAAKNYSCFPNFYYYKKKLAKRTLPPPSDTYSFEVFKYNESLVSLKGFEQLD